MKTSRPADFHAALAHMGVSLELSEAREGLSGFSTDGQRGYLVSASPKGWRAEIVAPEDAMKTLFEGASKDEAAMSCLCNEAVASGQVSEEIFLHRQTGVQLRDSKLLAKGSQYVDRHGNQIGIAYLRPHDLRRTFAGLLDARRVPLQDIRVVLRHDTIDATHAYLADNPLRARRHLRRFTLDLGPGA